MRYADDFVVSCESKEDAETTLGVLQGWLAHRGLALSEEKARIAHRAGGCDVPGFTIRRYKTPHTRTG